MPEFSLANLTDFDLSKDGRKTVLNFQDESAAKVSLKLTTINLELVTQELAFLLTKARQLSDVSKQNIVPFLHPARFRADVLTEGGTVVVSFELPTGLQHHYGLEPSFAMELARQLHDAAQRGMTTTSPKRHCGPGGRSTCAAGRPAKTITSKPGGGAVDTASATPWSCWSEAYGTMMAKATVFGFAKQST
jgi:hypothetical protein